jgi:hypothetical protein
VLDPGDRPADVEGARTRPCASPGGTSRPSTPSVTISGRPPARVTTGGRPRAMASIKAIERPSNLEASVNTSEPDTTRGTSLRNPAKMMESVMPSRSACFRTSASSGPTPTRMKRTSGISRRTSTAASSSSK